MSNPPLGKDSFKIRCIYCAYLIKRPYPIDQRCPNCRKPLDIMGYAREEKKQEISSATQNLANALKEQYIEHDQFERLTNDELTVLESFTSKRMFLTHIAIIANQSRLPLGIKPFNNADLEKILDTLVSKDYLEVELVGEKNVYILTERGKYKLQ